MYHSFLPGIHVGSPWLDEIRETEREISDGYDCISSDDGFWGLQSYK